MSDHQLGDQDPVSEFRQRVNDDTKRIIKYADEQGPTDSRSAIKTLFSKIIDDLSINDRKWRRLMENYLRDPTNGIPNNTDEHVQQRSSINKNFLSNESMTWVMLCRALRFIRVKRFRISLTLVHSNNTTTEHGIWLTVRNEYQPLEEEDDPQRTLNRIPTLQVRQDGQDDPVVPAGTGANSGPPQTPTAVDLAGWRRAYTPTPAAKPSDAE